MLRKLFSSASRYPASAMLVIFCLSFGIRFALLLNVPRQSLMQAGESGNIAKAIVSKGQFADPYLLPTGPTAHTTPFFPVLLAGIFKLFGTGYRGQFVRCLVDIASYSLLYALYPIFASLFKFPFSAGLFGGLASALLPLRRSAELFRGWDEPYGAMILALLLVLTLKRWTSERKDKTRAIVLGISWGLAMYVSSSLLSIAVGLMIVDLWKNRTARAWRDNCLIVAAGLVVIAPWLLRNHQQLHAWTFMRDNFGLELRYSNHDHVAPSAALVNADPASQQLHPSNSRAESLLVQQMGEVAYQRRELHLGIAWIANHPAAFISLSLRRFFYFWFGEPQHPIELLVTSCYTIAGLVGLFFIRKRVGENQFRIWCTALVFYPLVYYLVQYVSRYRVPIDWMIWISAGLLVSTALEKRRNELSDWPAAA